MTGTGTPEDPWQLRQRPEARPTAMYRDDEAGLLVCQVGTTKLTYLASAVDDLHAMLREHGDWMPLGAADEKKEAAEGTVEAWGRVDRQPRRWVVRPAQGLPRTLRHVPAAAARGARSRRARAQRAQQPRPRGLI